jgi:hypothetical protein
VTLEGRDPIAGALLAAIRGGDLEALDRLFGERPELASARIVETRGARARRCTSPPTGPATSPTVPRRSACCSRPVPIPTRRSRDRGIRKPRCTGRQAATTSRSWTLCWTAVPTSKPRAPRLRAAHRWTTRLVTASGGWPADWSSGAPRQSCGTRPRWSRGADLNWIATWDGQTALDIADRAGHAELVAWLRSHGARAASELR